VKTCASRAPLPILLHRAFAAAPDSKRKEMSRRATRISSRVQGPKHEPGQITPRNANARTARIHCSSAVMERAYLCKIARANSISSAPSTDDESEILPFWRLHAWSYLSAHACLGHLSILVCLCGHFLALESGAGKRKARWRRDWKRCSALAQVFSCTRAQALVPRHLLGELLLHWKGGISL